MARIQYLARCRLTLVAVSAWLLLPASSAFGQDVTESSLKAAYVVNIMRFTTWPKDVLAPGAPLRACVIGDAAFGEALSKFVKDHPVDGHPIVVSTVAADAVVRPCHVLYMSGISLKQAAQVTAGLDAAPVLTLSDVDQFARSGGGVLQLYVENSRILFFVNLTTARRSRLQLSSRLLALARIVEDDSKPR